MKVNRMQIEVLVPKTDVADILLSFDTKAEAERMLGIMGRTVRDHVTVPIYNALKDMVRDWV